MLSGRCALNRRSKLKLDPGGPAYDFIDFLKSRETIFGAFGALGDHFGINLVTIRCKGALGECSEYPIIDLSCFLTDLGRPAGAGVDKSWAGLEKSAAGLEKLGRV